MLSAIQAEPSLPIARKICHVIAKASPGWPQLLEAVIAMLVKIIYGCLHVLSAVKKLFHFDVSFKLIAHVLHLSYYRVRPRTLPVSVSSFSWWKT